MRELTVDFNSENPLINGCDAGYIGENNATRLIIRPSAEHLGSGATFFVVVFMSKGKIYRSEHFEPAEEFEIMLGSHLTRDHYLKVQLEGYAEEDMLVCKSPMISEIRLLPSIEGCETEIDNTNYLLRTQIELNSECRHMHENEEVLGSLHDCGGRLGCNGKPVCSRGAEKSVVLSVDSGEIDAMVTTSGYTYLSVYSYSDIGDFVIPQDAEIKSVELGIEHSAMPEWVDMRDMIIYDPLNPYTLFCRKIFFDTEMMLTTVCKAYFFNLCNTIGGYVKDMCLKKVRITYVVPFEETAADE